MLVAATWEHISQGGHTARQAKMYQEKFGIGLIDDDITRTELKHFLPTEEHDRLIGYANTATQIKNEQSRDLVQLREQGLIKDFRHMELANLLKIFTPIRAKMKE